MARDLRLVVCLDTSHSMVGGRERLAKAVVCEVRAQAWQQPNLRSVRPLDSHATHTCAPAGASVRL
eukprot:3828836-Prymnesium_polylepis.1